MPSLFQRIGKSIEIKSWCIGFRKGSLNPAPFPDKPRITRLHQQLCKLQKSLIEPCCSHPIQPALTFKRRRLNMIDKYFYDNIFSKVHQRSCLGTQHKYLIDMPMFMMNIFWYLFIQTEPVNCIPMKFHEKYLNSRLRRSEEALTK